MNILNYVVVCSIAYLVAMTCVLALFGMCDEDDQP